MFDPILHIEFYDKSHGAVKLDWNHYPFVTSSASSEMLYDTVFFSCYLLRELRNSGEHPVTDALIRVVTTQALNTEITEFPMKLEDEHVIYYAGAAIGISESQMKDYKDPLYLIEYKGNGKRRFIGAADVRPSQFLFTLSVKGFGLGYLLGLGLSSYTPEAVLLFLGYLRKKYNSPKYDRIIKGVIEDTISAYRYGRTTFQNQEQLGYEIAKKWVV